MERFRLNKNDVKGMPLDSTMAAIAKYAKENGCELFIMYKEHDPKGFWPSIYKKGQQATDRAQTVLEKELARIHGLRPGDEAFIDDDYLQVFSPKEFFSRIYVPKTGLIHKLHFVCVEDVDIYAGKPCSVIPASLDKGPEALPFDAHWTGIFGGDSESAAKEMAERNLAKKLVELGQAAGGENSIGLQTPLIRNKDELWSA